MRKKNYKGRCEKRAYSKCRDICRTYSPVQAAYAAKLEMDTDVSSFQCNVELEDSEYTTDFLVTMNNGTLSVCECVPRNHLTKPQTIRLLDDSLSYWKKRGIVEWKVITDAEKE